MKVPSGFPGASPSFWNCAVRYATAFSSPGVPGARPSIESADKSLMCCRSEALSIACAAAVTAEELAVVSVKPAEGALLVESADGDDFFSVTHPESADAATSTT